MMYRNIQNQNSDRLNPKTNPTVVKNLQAPKDYFVDNLVDFNFFYGWQI